MGGRNLIINTISAEHDCAELGNDPHYKLFYGLSWPDTKILTPDLGSRKGLIQTRYQDICKRNFQFWPPGGWNLLEQSRIS